MFCICRPDSIICKICEPTVKEKPGGGSARRRSAKSGRGSAAKYAPGDEEAAVGDTAETSGVYCSIGSTTGFHNHREGPY